MPRATRLPKSQHYHAQADLKIVKVASPAETLSATGEAMPKAICNQSAPPRATSPEPSGPTQPDYSMSHLAELNENTPLSDLAAAIRRYNRVILEHQRSALRTSLDLGDVLAWARARVETRGWKTWRAEHCSEVGKRRDEVCRQLAASRSIIELALVDNPDLSIRDALKLITVPKARSAKPKPAALEKWRVLSADEKRAGLATDTIDAFLEYMPPGWRDELADRVARVKHKTAQDRGLSARLREVIETNPEDLLAKYVRGQAIDPKHLTVHVAAIDAPSLRRRLPPLVGAQVRTGSAAVH